MNDEIRHFRTFLGMPGYGRMTCDAARALWRASRDMDDVLAEYRQGSLLAANFNALWCTALNMLHAGRPPKYFAMLHDDIGPQDWWLDELIAELEERDLDVLGVVVPIKDNRGITSIALDRDGSSCWLPLCRLSMAEILSLPSTFTSDDVGHPLLLNTGCWVCRFDPEWVTKVHFTINDKIVFNKSLNGYQAITEPEDWFFSRLCHEIGLKLGATRKIEVTHRGEYEFGNTNVWGQYPFDREYVKESQLPADRFRYPFDVMGWLTEPEGEALFTLARDKKVLEIGSYCGCSTICLAQSAKHVTALDFHDGRGTASPLNTLPEIQNNLRRYGLTDRVSIVHPDWELPDQEFDLAFIDGAHDYESVKADIEKSLAMLKPDGLIAFHDYASQVDPGVTAAVDELLAGGAKLLSVTDSLAVVRPPAAIPLEV